MDDQEELEKIFEDYSEEDVEEEFDDPRDKLGGSTEEDYRTQL